MENILLKQYEKIKKIAKSEFTVILNKKIIIIKYKNKEYTLELVNDNGILFWMLNPYKKTFFYTKLKNIGALFLAIKEDNDPNDLLIFKCRKETIKRILIEKNSFINNGTILTLLNNDYLNKYIERLNNKQTVTKINYISNKNNISPEEQFIQLIDSYISFYYSKFIFVEQKEIILRIIFSSNDNEFLYCKKYIGNNKYIDYFNKNFILFTVDTFKNNCNKLYPFIKQELNSIGINKQTINKPKELLEVLINLCITAKNEIGGIIYLLKDINNSIDFAKQNYKDSEQVIDMFIYQWKELINIYHNNYQIIDCLKHFNN